MICTYGLDAVYDPKAVVHEMMRVAKGGALVVAAYKSFPTSRAVGVLDAFVEAYFRLFWKCRNVELDSLFGNARLMGIREEHYYSGMVRIIMGRKPRCPRETQPLPYGHTEKSTTATQKKML